MKKETANTTAIHFIEILRSSGRYSFIGNDVFNAAIEALEIAERLKQAITDEQTADCIIVDAGCVNNKHDKEVWLNGYNQALADIRGEEE